MGEWRLEFLPVEPFAGVLFFVGMAWLIWRESRRLSGKKRWAWNVLRGAEWVLFMGILFQITWVETTWREPTAAFLLDASASMEFPDGRREEWFRAADFFSEKLGFPRETVGDSESSPLGDKLTKILETRRPDAVILVSDGIVTNGKTLDEAGRLAAERGVPVFPILCGKAEPLPRLAVHWKEMRSRLQTGEPALFPVGVETEMLAGRTVSCKLCDREKTLAETSFTPDSNVPFSQEITLRWTPPAVGKYSLSLVVTAGEGGLPLLSRAIPWTLTVSQGTRNILLVAQTPDWEYRYLRNLLRREPGFRLKTWLASAGKYAVEQDETAQEAFPDQASLDALDLVILDDCDAATLGEENAAKLIRFAKSGKGKAVCVLWGRVGRLETWRGTPLEKMLPFSLAGVTHREESARMNSTPQAVNTPIPPREAWKKTPEIFSWWEIPHVFPDVRVLAEFAAGGKTFPAVLFRRTGANAVLVHATHSSWRWRWRSEDDFYREYWISMLHWLAEGSTSNEERETEMLPPPKEILEYARTAADEKAMRQLAERSGGRFFHVQEMETAVREVFLTLQSLSDKDVVEKRYPLGTHPAVFGLLLFLLAVQWGIRRYSM